MIFETLIGLALPFLGTAAGAACVFFLAEKHREGLETGLNGFAAGVMVAACIWSLLTPAMELSVHWGKLCFVPALIGLFGGFFFFTSMDLWVSRQQREKGSRMVLAVNLHNLPEGMAVGAVYAGCLAALPGLCISEALALSAGIAIQNIPEGAIVSLPQRRAGRSSCRAFGSGLFSGLIEPLGALATIACYRIIHPALPYLLGFAAGAMLYVVIRELIPSLEQGRRPNQGALLFAMGFSLMMALDVSLG